MVSSVPAVVPAFVGHVADGGAVDLHRQGIGAAHHHLDHRHQNGQGGKGQKVDCHPGQKPGIAHRAPAEVLQVGRDAGPEAVRPPHLGAVHPDVAQAAAEDVDRAEQLPQDGARPGEGDLHHIVPSPEEGGRQPESGGADGPPGPDEGVLAGKAEGIQPVAQLPGKGQGADQGAQGLGVQAGAGLDAVAAQQAAALETGPGGPQFISCGQGRRGGWRAARLLIDLFDLFVNQKRVSPSGGFQTKQSAQGAQNAKRQPGRRGGRTSMDLLSIIHPGGAEARFCTGFGHSFHRLFTKTTRPCRRAAGFPP